MGSKGRQPRASQQDSKHSKAAVITPLAVAAALCCAGMGLFALAIALGCSSHEPDPLVAAGLSRSSLNPLLQYDLLLRKAGPVLPLIPPVLRAAVTASGKPPPRSFLLPGLLHTSAVYVAAATIRVALYLAGLPGGVLGKPQPLELHAHWMSDHILLGSSMTAALAAEAAILTAFLLQGMRLSGAAAARILLSLVVAVALFALTVVDMHYTAKFFHPVTENLRAWAVGLLIFQAPLATWVVWRCQ
eukprot:CAMPEP_0117656452 /NCGR_PEP_ID=MMETSP0804-20121206/4812_1 /TAXON_ID=1074897 /ORGANISM="Tetraselmis astigmatica, Strain CCMP880" /LENGTH=244 /DNA_ID=CAMNT_0005462855 /DNA_START=636 /DNA_END=1367 /DNA_ORIENTATION=-